MLRPGRRHVRFGPGRRREVARRIGGGFAVSVDRLELILRVAGEDEVVMREMLVGTIEAEVEHDAGAGRFIATPAPEAALGHAADQVAVGSHTV